MMDRIWVKPIEMNDFFTQIFETIMVRKFSFV
jgi:hypothetical protein